MADQPVAFDPIRMLQTLDRHRVNYIVIGAFARVIHGADEVTDCLDIAPLPRPENLRRLELATAELGVSSFPLDVSRPISLDTQAGALKVVPSPIGTGGYPDLRRGASREPLGSGVRPSVASLGDLARMLAAYEADPAQLQQLRRIAELETTKTPTL